MGDKGEPPIGGDVRPKPRPKDLFPVPTGSKAGPAAAFDRDAYGRFRLPRGIAEASSGWDHPEAVPGSEAFHMRPDDYVIGVAHRDVVRAYPLWVIDNYHAINDRMSGSPVLVASCERCQSGAAFEALVPGNEARPPTFRAVGVLNATLVLKDLRSGTYWDHYRGVGLRGPAAGTRLPSIPAYHMEWQDWLSLHPDTEVVLPPRDPRHPDARHGHGREELFARPGIDPAFIPTITGDIESPYPENEPVIGLELEGSVVAYPLREVQREGGVVLEETPMGPVVIFAGPREDGFTMAAYLSSSSGRVLHFRRRRERFVDEETKTEWTIEGRATDGPLKGDRLRPVPWYQVRWHAWFFTHRDTRLYRSGRPFADARTEHSDPDAATAFLQGLAAEGHEVRVVGPVVTQRKPRETTSSLTAFVDGDRINVHLFMSERAARDFAAMDGAWSGAPYRAKILGGKVARSGRLVVESDPVERFVDPAQIVPIPDEAVKWASVLDGELLSLEPAPVVEEEDSGPEARVGFAEVLRTLKRRGFDVIEGGFLPPGQLRVSCVNGMALTVEGDAFLLYRFSSRDLAAQYAAEEPRTVQFGPFVLRSTPDTMYLHPGYEIHYAGDQSIRWSPLLRNRGFLECLAALCEPT